MRTIDLIISSEGVDQYQNDNFMGKESPNKYTCVKATEDFSNKKMCIKLGQFFDVGWYDWFKVSRR